MGCALFLFSRVSLMTCTPSWKPHSKGNNFQSNDQIFFVN